VQLAHDGIPVEGAALLLRRDPLTQGPRLFQTNCAGCHSHDKEPVDPDPKKEKPKKKASNLTNWGSYDWVRGLLKNPGDDNYFGRVKDIDEEIDKHKEVLVLTEMIRWRKGIDRLEKDKLPVVEKRLGQIAYFVAEQAKPRHERNRQILSEGRGPFIDNCYKCHGVVSDDDYNYKEHMVDGNKVDLTQRERKAPDLSRYGSAEWLRLMIMSPAHKSRYGWTPDNLSLPRNYMTAFRPLDGPAAEVPFREFLEKFPQMEKKTTPLPDIEREILIRWLINDNRIVVGGTTISAMKK
jgi:ubiquinol-cytochrome c reductase cytochrome b subunit